MQRGILGGLLGAAAGIAMVSAASAADLPVKAKPVEYVKICSAYGAGFYYIPGTDICLRVGGYVYLETGVKALNGVANIYGSNDGVINSAYNYMNWRSSTRIILDARQNTAYGTLRAYLATGVQNINHSGAVGLDAAYIQFAGFTWGYTNSFFSFAPVGYGIVASPMADWAWLSVAAYTAQLGNGLTASISIEDPKGRRAGLDGVATAAGPVTATSNAYGGSWAPEVVGNINVTQAWGRAQIMGALHQVKPNRAMLGPVDTEWGYAVGGGIEIKTPQTGNPSNSFLLQGVYAKGAVDYTGYNSSPTAGFNSFASQKNSGLGPVFAVNDGFLNAAGTEIELTKAWSVYAGYRHYWTPMLRTSFGAGFLNIDEGSDLASLGEIDVVQANVSTVWSPVAGLDLSLDIVYSDLETTSPAGVKSSNDLWTAWTRVRRNF
ncbi:MAG: porin [Bradyrhizobiaceae bacterium]|nr:porin [Bradyrhizobiaceae bacterium]